MKIIKNLLIIFMMSLFQNVLGQNLTQDQWTKIRTEAYYDFIQNGGTLQQWNNNSDKIAQDFYKRKYTYDNSGEVQRKQSNDQGTFDNVNRPIGSSKNGYNNSREVKSKQSYVQGTFVSANGPIGSFKNSYVLNSMGQTLGYLSQGYFMNSQQQCIGFVNGNQILSCNGDLLATVNNNGVYSPQGYLIYAIKGESLYSQNFLKVQISGMNINSLAAYLLFYK